MIRTTAHPLGLEARRPQFGAARGIPLYDIRLKNHRPNSTKLQISFSYLLWTFLLHLSIAAKQTLYPNLVASNNWLFLSTLWVDWAQLRDSSALLGFSGGNTFGCIQLWAWLGLEHPYDFIHWCFSFSGWNDWGATGPLPPASFPLSSGMSSSLCHQTFLPIQVQIPYCHWGYHPKKKMLPHLKHQH